MLISVRRCHPYSAWVLNWEQNWPPGLYLRCPTSTVYLCYFECNDTKVSTLCLTWSDKVVPYGSLELRVLGGPIHGRNPMYAEGERIGRTFVMGFHVLLHFRLYTTKVGVCAVLFILYRYLAYNLKEHICLSAPQLLCLYCSIVIAIAPIRTQDDARPVYSQGLAAF